jgi:hypothetical protein
VGDATAQQRILIEAARAAVKDLREELRTLQSATAELGEPFTLQAVEQAFEERTSDAHVRVQVAALSWAATACCNQFNVLVQAGSVLAGFREPDPPGESPPSVTRDYALLRENGVITQAQRHQLSEFNSARIHLTHRYGQPQTPQALHKATSLALATLSTFAKDYGSWLKSLGILPSTRD